MKHTCVQKRFSQYHGVPCGRQALVRPARAQQSGRAPTHQQCSAAPAASAGCHSADDVASVRSNNAPCAQPDQQHPFHDPLDPSEAGSLPAVQPHAAGSASAAVALGGAASDDLQRFSGLSVPSVSASFTAAGMSATSAVPGIQQNASPSSQEAMLHLQLQLQQQIQQQMQQQMEAQMQQMATMQQQYLQSMQHMQQQMQAIQQMLMQAPGHSTSDGDTASTMQAHSFAATSPPHLAAAAADADAAGAATLSDLPTAAAAAPSLDLAASHSSHHQSEEQQASTAQLSQSAAPQQQELQTDQDTRQLLTSPSDGQQQTAVVTDAAAVRPAEVAPAALISTPPAPHPSSSSSSSRNGSGNSRSGRKAASVGSAPEQSAKRTGVSAAVGLPSKSKQAKNQRSSSNRSAAADAAGTLSSTDAHVVGEAAGEDSQGMQSQETSKVAAEAASGERATPSAAAPVKPQATTSTSATRSDTLLQRIENCRTYRGMSALFEKQQRWLRAHHLAAIMIQLPTTSDGRRALAELKAGAASVAVPASAAAGAQENAASSLSFETTAVLGFADDLITMLQLQLNQLSGDRLAALVQAAASLQLQPRPAWISSFLAASQPKLHQLDAAQLSSMASAVAVLVESVSTANEIAATSSSSKEGRTTKGQIHKQAPQQKPQQQQAKTVRLSAAWMQAWMTCSKQKLVELQASIRQQEQAVIQQQTVAAAAAEGTAAPHVAPELAANTAQAADQGQSQGSSSPLSSKNPQVVQGSSAASDGALVGRLAVAAVELGVLGRLQPPSAEASKQPGTHGVTTAERIAWMAALCASAATAATAVQSKALSATAASQILHALSVQHQSNPALMHQLDVQFRQQADGRSSNSSASYVLSIVAAVAAAAKGSMKGSRVKVLMQLLEALRGFGIQPDDDWLIDLATSINLQRRHLTTRDCLTAVHTFGAWMSNRHRKQHSSEHQQKAVHDAVNSLAAGLVLQLSQAATELSALQICSVVSSIALQMGYAPVLSTAQDAAAVQAFTALLEQLAHSQVLGGVPTLQVLKLLQGLSRMQVPVQHSFAAAVQRDAVQPHVQELLPQQFADVADSLAGLHIPMEKDLLDGYWQHVSANLGTLAGGDFVLLLSAMGALRQKPKSQHLGPFLQGCMGHLQGCSQQQLVDVLSAMSCLQLTDTDTQGVRISTAAGAPTPGKFVDEVVRQLSPTLAGIEGASAQQIGSVLQSLVKLGCPGVDQAWLTMVLGGAASKLSTAVAQGHAFVLVDMLAALGQISLSTGAFAPADLLDHAVLQFKAVLDQLDARQIAMAMSALKQLRLDPDDSIMKGYLDRAAVAAAAGLAAPQDLATVLLSVAASGVVPPADWYQTYLITVQQQLTTCDSTTLANICRATATIAIAGRQGSVNTTITATTSSSGSDRDSASSGVLSSKHASSNGQDSSYEVSAGFLAALLAVANSRIGSNYMDAARILSAPDYKPPLNLSGMADCCWGLLKLGADPAAVQSLINMLISKSYDRFTTLSGSQLAGIVWSVACCSSSNAVGNRGGKRGLKLPGKWLNQLAAAAAQELKSLEPGQFSDLIWGLGLLYRPAEGYSSRSNSSVSNVSAAASGNSSAEPVQQLLKAAAGQLHSKQLELAPADDVSCLVNLLAQFDCPASKDLLARFCADVATCWKDMSDAQVTDAAVAVATLASPKTSSVAGRISTSWLEGLADQLQHRASDMSPGDCCKCIWSLSTLGHIPSLECLDQLVVSVTLAAKTTQLTPGELVDALWGIYTLEQNHRQPFSTIADSAGSTSSDVSSSNSRSSCVETGGGVLTLELMQALELKLYKRVHELQPPQIVRLMELAEGALERVPGYHLPSGIGEQMSATLSVRATAISDTDGVLKLACAAAALKLPLHGSAVDHICRKLYGQLDSLSASDMARGFWASSRLRYGWVPPQLQQFDLQSQAKLQEMSAVDVSLLLEAFKVYGFAPSQAWLQQFAGMPHSSLCQLSNQAVMQLAVQLSDPKVGVPARSIQWLLDWANELTAADLTASTSSRLFELVHLLAEATLQGSNGSDTTCIDSRKVPSAQLLGLLCWAIAEHVSSASTVQVCQLVRALAGWEYNPPNGRQLLSAAAARVADKLPMMDQVQLCDILCGFAKLGFCIGEPLQSKLCSRLLQSIAAAVPKSAGSLASSDSASRGPMHGGSKEPSTVLNARRAAAVLASILVSITEPPEDLVQGLMQQLSGQLAYLPADQLLHLGRSFLAAGWKAQDTSHTAEHAQAALHTLPEQLSQELLAGIRSRVPNMSALQVGATCSILDQLGLKADEATAAALVLAFNRHTAAAAAAVAASGSDSRSSYVGLGPALLVPVVAYLSDSGFRPAAAGVTHVEQLVLQTLHADRAGSGQDVSVLSVSAVNSDSSSGSSAGTGAAAPAVLSGVPQQPNSNMVDLDHQKLQLMDFVRLVKGLHDWGATAGSDLTAAAYDWSRHRMVDADVSTLGPLLLWLSSFCGKPPSPWLADWSGVVQGQLAAATASDLPVLAAALNQAGASVSTAEISTSWWTAYSTAVLQELQRMSDSQLEVLLSSMYKLKFRPTQPWQQAVLQELQSRVSDSSLNTAAARALAWVQQIRAA